MREIKWLQETWTKQVFYLLALLFCLQHAWATAFFGCNVFDTDQYMMWQAAIDVSQGHFYFPYFYGQAYNSMAEAWLAAPLLWVGVHVSYAVPITTGIMALTPWLIVLAICYKTQRFKEGIVVIFMASMFNSDYIILTHMSRGFIQGIFFSMLGFSLWYFGSRKPWLLGGFVFLCLFGFLQNPNTIFLFPVFVISYWQKKWLKINYLIWAALAISLTLLIKYSADIYCETHKDWLIHYSPNTSSNWNQFIKNLKNGNDYSQHIFWGDKISVIVFLLNLGLVAYLSGAWKTTLPLLVSILFTLSFMKLGDYYQSVYFSASRYFISVPLALALILAIRVRFISKKLLIFIAIASLFGLVTTNVQLISKFKHMPWRGFEAPVLTLSRAELTDLTDSLNKKAEDAEVMLVYDSYLAETAAIGCNLLKPKFKYATRYTFERRGWLKTEMDAFIPKKIIILDNYIKADSVFMQFPEAIKKTMAGTAFLISNKKKENISEMMIRWKKLPRQ